MNTEKDIFEQFHEAADTLTEQPTERTWNALERRLDAAAKRRRPKRHGIPTQLILATLSSLVLILLLSVIGWFVTFQQHQIQEGRKKMEQLNYIVGKFQTTPNTKTMNLLALTSNTDAMIGYKAIYLDGALLSTVEIAVHRIGKDVFFIYDQKNKYKLTQISKNIATFDAQSNPKSTLRLEQLPNETFAMQFDDGTRFVFFKTKW